jgi:hypothetical protein
MLTYLACGNSDFNGREPGSAGGCDFTQRTMAFPSLTSGMYPISRFTVSIVSERVSLVISGSETGGIAAVAMLRVGDDAGLNAAALTESRWVPAASGVACTGGGTATTVTSLAMSGPGTAGIAGVAVLRAGNDAGLDAVATGSPGVPVASCGGCTGDGEAAAAT